MNNIKTLLALAMATSLSVHAETIQVKQFLHSGPYAVLKPYMMDSLNVCQKKFDLANMLEYCSSHHMSSTANTSIINGTSALATNSDYAIQELSFSINSTYYTKATLKIDSLAHYKAFLDDKSTESDLTLEPGVHTILIRYLAEKGKSEDAKISIETPRDGIVTVTTDNSRYYTIYDVLHAKKYGRNTSISPNGKYMIVTTSKTDNEGKTVTESKVCDIATSRIISSPKDPHWMPTSSCYYTTQTFNDVQTITAFDPSSGKQTILATNIPKDMTIVVSPTEDYLILTKQEEGPKEDPNVYQVIHPDDRQPGWRDRSSIYRFDLKSGIMQQLIYGYHNVYVADISKDGKYILLQKSESRLTKRPTTLFSLLRIDVKTLQCDTIVSRDGFISSAIFSPDGKKILVSGSPESFNGIGKNVREGQTPSMVDNQLFMVTIADKSVKSLTRNFNPNVQDMQWSQSDDMVYFSAEDRDCIHLFQLNPATGKIKQIPTNEELLDGFDVSSSSPTILYRGVSASNSDRLYSLNAKSNKSTLLEDLSKDNIKGIKLGKCEAWSFLNSRGDTILCRYYLPPTFDSNKQYPMIVNYYGGCSPTSRHFESRYPHHAYAAKGYVVLVVEPSGATGFGQEFSARHVNTAGEGPAEDIIEATNEFCRQHNYVNSKKIGCIGASYGGFMTQYLQTKTDIFAAAISHAGISDHTSYWGEGYWGYSYSEVSMANSYPWSQPDLYTHQSPLFNADKIHTPLLFLHGDADHNVPVGESIQMYNALKLLGRETAFVAVKDQDHHILEYNKRIKWQNTIFAWFAKYLQDDSTWWDALYPEKQL